jgi:hypothetical protein
MPQGEDSKAKGEMRVRGLVKRELQPLFVRRTEQQLSQGTNVVREQSI